MATDFAGLVPSEVVPELISAIEEQSVVMALGHVVPMGTGVAAVPVSKTAPVAKFVSPTIGGRKPVSQIDWSAENLVAEEIAITLAIPDSFIDDFGIPVWQLVQPEVASAIAVCLDQAVLFGGGPATFPVGGIAAVAGPAVSDADPFTALDQAMTAVESTGLTVDGIAGPPALRSALRTISAHQLVPSSSAPVYSFYGTEVATTPVWDSAAGGDAIVGDWSKLVLGVRQDIQIDMSSDGVLLNPDNTIAVSAFQDDMTLMRAYLRVACVIGIPGQADGSGTTRPFASAKWTGVAGTLSARSASSKARA